MDWSRCARLVLVAFCGTIGAACATQTAGEAADGQADAGAVTVVRATGMAGELRSASFDEAAAGSAGVSASHAEAARRTLELTDSRKSLDYMHDQIYPMMFSVLEEMNIGEENAEIFRRYAGKMKEFLAQELSWERMEPAMIEIYTRVYTEEELEELNAFYASPTGRKMIERMPQLMEESMRFSQQMIRDFLPKLQRYQDEIEAEILAELGEAGRDDGA